MKNNIHLTKKVVTAWLVLYDIVAVNFSFFFALWFRFDCLYSEIPEHYLRSFVRFAPLYTVFCILIFSLCRMYRSIWRYAGHNELLRVMYASAITFGAQCIGITLLFERMPLSYYVFGILLQFTLTAGIRMSYRFLLAFTGGKSDRRNGPRIMIVGAGSAGQTLLRDIQMESRQVGRVCCIIDDNPNKWGLEIDGVQVIGGRERIVDAVKKYQIDNIYIAIPSASGANRKEILSICNETSCKIKVLPAMYQLVNDEVMITSLKDVSINDLLGRDPVETDLSEVFRFITGRSILVTGGGGSIGSELCRQIASHHPKQLIIFDVYENNAYSIQMELMDAHPDYELITLIGSVRDRDKLLSVFEKYRPEIVFHAAAHKHVPLMEDSPCEAIKNNVMGTYNTALAALVYGCKRFVLISTDKAVNPTNIMGASKRICEMIIQTFAAKVQSGKTSELRHLFFGEEGSQLFQILPEKAATEFVAVRFGNVLGSNGSVIPRFKQQIENGGPVTVTHPDIIRYFMTIPEAVSLVLQAGTYANGGEIFVLDMGSPVKIDTLARNMIRLSGLQPDIDIKIIYTGLRPGEKLYEETLMNEEGLKTTPNKLIHIGRPIEIDYDCFIDNLRMLIQAAQENSDIIRTLVSQIVPTFKYTGSDSVNAQ